MQNHDQFEELCAVAAGGGLRYEDLQILKAHLEECYPCRELLTQLSEIHAQWLPEGRDIDFDRDPAREAALRSRILKSAGRAGAHLSRNALRGSGDIRSWANAWESPQLWVFTTAAMLLIMAGTWLFVRVRTTDPGIASTSPARTSPAPVPPAIAALPPAQADIVPADRLVKLDAIIDSLKKRQSELEDNLQREQRRADLLDTANADSRQTIATLRKQLDESQTERSAAEASLERVKATHATDEAVTLVEQQEIAQLNKQISDQQAAIDRGQQMLSSGREIRDLIAARNLHIIDVYDTDAHGKTTPAFGRVFYTEGKSLIFYAYDLGGGPRPDGDIAFYVWGKQDGSPQNVRKLGAFVKDAKAQQRWVFALTDPKILAEIDSVFVTLEPGNKANAHPSGKRLLSAFLGSPANHP